MKPYRLYILDLDGTVYRGAEPLPGAVATVAKLQERGAQIRYLTNNSGLTRSSYVSKLRSMGFEVDAKEIYSSAIGAANVCVEDARSLVFYVGEPGLRQTLEDSGLKVVNTDEEGTRQADAVVVGICRTFSYRWMNSALQQLLGGATFLATNTDATYPLERGSVAPGAGAVVASIQTAFGSEPRVIGKPNPYLIQMILRDSGVDPCEALAVGDRYETDILSGVNAGVDTHLVLTGITQVVPEGVSWSEDLTGLLSEGS